MRTALTIAGSDSSGGAGIQADIKTMTANGVFALCAVTALTAQNTTGVTDIFDSTPHFLAEQLDAVFTDIFPDAVKIGMVSSAELIETIAAKLKEYGAKHIVVDPVMVATSGAKLLRDDAVNALCEKLLPLAEVLTPNIPEAEILSGMTIQNAADMERARGAGGETHPYRSCHFRVYNLNPYTLFFPVAGLSRRDPHPTVAGQRGGDGQREATAFRPVRSRDAENPFREVHGGTI